MHVGCVAIAREPAYNVGILREQWHVAIRHARCWNYSNLAESMSGVSSGASAAVVTLAGGRQALHLSIRVRSYITSFCE